MGCITRGYVGSYFRLSLFNTPHFAINRSVWVGHVIVRSMCRILILYFAALWYVFLWGWLFFVFSKTVKYVKTLCFYKFWERIWYRIFWVKITKKNPNFIHLSKENALSSGYTWCTLSGKESQKTVRFDCIAGEESFWKLIYIEILPKEKITKYLQRAKDAAPRIFRRFTTFIFTKRNSFPGGIRFYERCVIFLFSSLFL